MILPLHVCCIELISATVVEIAFLLETVDPLIAVLDCENIGAVACKVHIFLAKKLSEIACVVALACHCDKSALRNEKLFCLNVVINVPVVIDEVMSTLEIFARKRISSVKRKQGFAVCFFRIAEENNGAVVENNLENR